MYPTNNYLLLKEVAEGTPSPMTVGTGNTPVLYNPNAASHAIRRYEVVDVSSNRLSDVLEVGDIVAVRVKDVEEFFDGVLITDYDNLLAMSKRGKL